MVHFQWVNHITCDLCSLIDSILILWVPLLLTLLLYPVLNKFPMAFALFLTLHLFFGIIYLTLFVSLLHICPLEKTWKYICLIKPFLHILLPLYLESSSNFYSVLSLKINIKCYCSSASVTSFLKWPYVWISINISQISFL